MTRFYALAAVVVVCLISLAVIARNWSCRKRRPPRPPIQRTFTVDSVPTGASIICKHRRRTKTVMLQYVAAPLEGREFFEESRANLEQLAGKQIRVEYKRRLRGDEPEGSTIVGVAYGEGGACLNLSQIRDGWVMISDGKAPEEWQKAQEEAMEALRGFWVIIKDL